MKASLTSSTRVCTAAPPPPASARRPRSATSRACWNTVGKTWRSGVTHVALTPFAFRSWMTLCFHSPVSFCLDTHPSGAAATRVPKCRSAAALSSKRNAKPDDRCD